jgi:hypothetical protein
MKNYRLERFLLFALVSLFLSGLVFSKSANAEDPLAAVKNSIQSKLDGGDSVAEAVCQIVKDVTDEKKTNSCVDTATAAVEMELDVQEVVASAIDCGCDPLAVGNAAYNAGATLHDVYMAGGSTSNGSTGLQYTPDDVEQPTDRPASPFVPRDNDDKRFGFKD